MHFSAIGRASPCSSTSFCVYNRGFCHELRTERLVCWSSAEAIDMRGTCRDRHRSAPRRGGAAHPSLFDLCFRSFWEETTLRLHANRQSDARVPVERTRRTGG